MKKILKGLLLFTTVIVGISVFMIMFFIYSNTVSITWEKEVFIPNKGNLAILMWMFFIAFVPTVWMMVPLVFKDVYWKTQKEVDNLKKNLSNAELELRRKIDKL